MKGSLYFGWSCFVRNWVLCSFLNLDLNSSVSFLCRFETQGHQISRSFVALHPFSSVWFLFECQPQSNLCNLCPLCVTVTSLRCFFWTEGRPVWKLQRSDCVCACVQGHCSLYHRGDGCSPSWSPSLWRPGRWRNGVWTAPEPWEVSDHTGGRGLRHYGVSVHFISGRLEGILLRLELSG